MATALPASIQTICLPSSPQVTYHSQCSKLYCSLISLRLLFPKQICICFGSPVRDRILTQSYFIVSSFQLICKHCCINITCRDKKRALRNYLESVTFKLISARLISSLCLDAAFGCLASVLNCLHTSYSTTFSKGGALFYRSSKLLSRP